MQKFKCSSCGVTVGGDEVATHTCKAKAKFLPLPPEVLKAIKSLFATAGIEACTVAGKPFPKGETLPSGEVKVVVGEGKEKVSFFFTDRINEKTQRNTRYITAGKNRIKIIRHKVGTDYSFEYIKE